MLARTSIRARADWFLFLCLGGRAGLLALERVQIFVLDARAFYSPLEQVSRIKVGSWAFLNHFLHSLSLSYFLKTLFESFSL